MYQVILVEDEGLVLDAIAKNIQWEKLGYQLMAKCKNGLEAKAYLSDHPVDLVITDICMPLMDGIELCEYLHDTYPQTKILICSGYNEFEYAQKALKYNVEEYILKPFTSLEFSEILENTKKKIDCERQKEASFEKMNESLSMSQSIIKEKLLDQLMKGNYDPDIVEELKDMKVQLEADYFRVALIELDGEDKSHAPSVKAIALKIAGEYNRGEVFSGEQNRTYIIFRQCIDFMTDEKLKYICGKIRSQVMKDLNQELTIVIGNKVKLIKQLKASWKTTIQGLDYRYTLGTGKLICFQEVQEKARGIPSYESHLKEILSVIKLGSEQKLKTAMQEIQKNFEQSMLSKSELSLYLNQLAARVNTFIRASENNAKEVLLLDEDLSETIAKSTNLVSIMTYLTDYFILLLKQFDLEKDISGKKLAMCALDYIENHYADNRVGLNSVCQYLCISTSHFSKLFKQNTGQTFVEALTEKRMNKAKELLTHTDLKNYEIAKKTGFNDAHYFGIAFKKYTGKTPKAFAKGSR